MSVFAQALQHWKDQFRGLYNSFEAERPATSTFLGTAPGSIFTAQPFESANTAANAHEFECAVCSALHSQHVFAAALPNPVQVLKLIGSAPYDFKAIFCNAVQMPTVGCV